MGLPQLKTYIAEQQCLEECVEIEICRKSEFYFIDDDITFKSIGLTLPVLDIYKRVDNEETREFFNLKSDANPRLGNRQK
jgi:hypothetical protein